MQSAAVTVPQLPHAAGLVPHAMLLCGYILHHGLHTLLLQSVVPPQLTICTPARHRPHRHTDPAISHIYNLHLRGIQTFQNQAFLILFQAL